MPSRIVLAATPLTIAKADDDEDRQLIEERAFWLAWSQIPGVGPVLLNRLQQHFGTLAAAWDANLSDLRKVEGFGYQTSEAVTTGRSRLQPQQFIQQHSAKNPHFWTPADADYPRLLLEIPSPPSVLYYRGKMQLPETHDITRAIGIVGTRNPSEYGRRWTRKISAALAKKGFTIVSGMAKGIDKEAHRGCLEAGGKTIAALGTGVDVIYPSENSELYKQFLNQGLAVSEYPAGTQPTRENFPRRNRIIAALSRAVLVMEAPMKSGALITAHYANDFCRDVYVLPGSLDNVQAVGCLGLLNKGAHVILGEGHLLEMLGEIPHLDPVESPPQFNQLPLPMLDPELAEVLKMIPSEPTSLDLIIEQTGMAAGLLSSALLQLELMGLVSQLPGMRYQRW